MFRRGSVLFLGGLLLVSFIAGCGDNVSIAKGKKWEGSKITLETIFTSAFDNVTWQAASNVTGEELPKTAFGMQEGLKNQVVVKGKISQGLHDFAVSQLGKGSKIAAFTAALRYAAQLSKNEQAAQDPEFKFDLEIYPFNEKGEVDLDKAESFLIAPENKDKVDTLINYYKKRYWEAGSDVMLVLSLEARGAVINIKLAQNKFWDNDIKYNGLKRNIMNVLFEYAQSKLSKAQI